MDIIPHTLLFLQQFDKIYLDFMHYFNATEKQQIFLFSILLGKKIQIVTIHKTPVLNLGVFFPLFPLWIRVDNVDKSVYK